MAWADNANVQDMAVGCARHHVLNLLILWRLQVSPAQYLKAVSSKK